MRPRPIIDEAKVREQAQRDWTASPDLRAEFGKVDAYVAYAVANARGQIKTVVGRAQRHVPARG